jgi:hypothetical protein
MLTAILGIIEVIGYHHILMVFIAIAIILLCEFSPSVMYLAPGTDL